MGLKLIQENSERNTKPRVIVVAEPAVHEALSSDLELDVYSECFDYDSFVKASLSKSISTNNAIVVLSDSLSQRVAPLEAVIALVRNNVVLIPWKSSEEEISALNVASCSPRPTANTLRRSIFEHAGMNELPPRFDGDTYIEEPPDARVVNFVQQTDGQPVIETVETSENLSGSPLDWFTAPETQPVTPPPITQENIDFLPPADQARIFQEHGEEKLVEEITDSITRTPSTQQEEPSFVPDNFSFVQPQHETTQHTDTSVVHPYAEFESLELDAYVNTDSDLDAYEIDDTTPATFVPDVAFAPIDDNGNQQMWGMFDTKIENPGGHNAAGSLTEFPDGSDNRKAITLTEPLVLCVYSPKGGVGKTSISVNMAARLAYTTRLQVCIVDLDIAFGNVGTRLGLYNPTVRELLNESHVDGESLARNLVYDRRSGLFALLAPLRPETGTNRRKFSPAAYKKILSLLKERFDVVILDCPVELRDPLVSGFALTESGRVLMVVNNEQATLLDARRALEAMCRPKDSQRLPGLGLDPTTVGMVVNQKVDNVGREVDDIKAVLGGGDPDHPSKQIEILSVIGDDRHLWVGNANMARTVATSGENDVDQLLDEIWTKLLPDEAASDFESQQMYTSASNPLDDIFSREEPVVRENKKTKRKLFGKKSKNEDEGKS